MVNLASRLCQTELKAWRFLNNKNFFPKKLCGRGIPDFYALGEFVEVKRIFQNTILFSKAQKEKFSDEVIIMGFDDDSDEPKFGRKWKDIKNCDFLKDINGNMIKIVIK